LEGNSMEEHENAVIDEKLLSRNFLITPLIYIVERTEVNMKCIHMIKGLQEAY